MAQSNGYYVPVVAIPAPIPAPMQQRLPPVDVRPPARQHVFLDHNGELQNSIGVFDDVGQTFANELIKRGLWVSYGGLFFGARLFGFCWLDRQGLVESQHAFKAVWESRVATIKSGGIPATTILLFDFAEAASAYATREAIMKLCKATSVGATCASLMPTRVAVVVPGPSPTAEPTIHTVYQWFAKAIW